MELVDKVFLTSSLMLVISILLIRGTDNSVSDWVKCIEVLFFLICFFTIIGSILYKIWS